MKEISKTGSKTGLMIQLELEENRSGMMKFLVWVTK